LRIGIDYTAAIRQGAGIGRYTRELVRALAELDRENDYVLFAATGGQQPPDEDWPPNFQMRSLPLSDRALAILWHRLRLPLWMELVTGPVDIFHSPDFVLPPVRRRAKTMLTVHDLSFIRYPQCADANLRAYLNKVVPRSVHRADLVLADSHSTKDDLVELLGVEPKKIEVVHPGVEERFRPIEDRVFLKKARKRYNLPPRFILGLGTLQPRKNFTRLIEAFANLRFEIFDLRLVIAGGKGWLYDDIFATVERLGLQDKVLFPGFVADEDLPALYNLANLFVFPSLYEGFGLPPLEAMACGTPVITSDASSLPEVVGEAGLMVEATDVGGLAEAMQRVLQDDALREEMMARGLEQAKKFTWQQAASKLLNLYETLGERCN
jgi:glycosyltransferase involved in cell wall biosynthesis